MPCVLLSVRNWPRDCCEDTLEWGRTLGGVGRGLGSYHTMKQRAHDRLAADNVGADGELVNEEEDKVTKKGMTCRFRFPVRKEFNRQNKTHVDFFYVDILSAVTSLLKDPQLVKELGDVHWRHEIFVSEVDGSRQYTPDLRSGQLWERTDSLYFGEPLGVDSSKAVLWVIVFIDAISVVSRGTTSAKPVMVTLGNFPERIRNVNVSIE